MRRQPRVCWVCDRRIFAGRTVVVVDGSERPAHDFCGGSRAREVRR